MSHEEKMKALGDVSRGDVLVLDRTQPVVVRGIISSGAGLSLIEVIWVENGKRRRGSYKPSRLSKVMAPPETK